MKRNDLPILIATAAYSFLFYRQSAGVNYFMFTFILVALLIIRDSSLLLSRIFLAAAAGSFISSFFVFWYDTPLPYIANIISLILLGGVSTDPQSSFIIACFHSIYSLLGAGFFMLIDIFRGFISPRTGGKSNIFSKAILAIVPVTIFLIFFNIYRASNPIFDQLVSRINFDFISICWSFFTLVGFILMYAFFRQRVISNIQRSDHDTPDELLTISPDQYMKGLMGKLISIPNLIYTGVLLLSLLNILLATVNGLDIYYLGILHTTPPGITFSQYLHNGTNSLIASIILAISVILFYFRGYLNFSENNKWLKNLSYTWIAQNILLVLSTAYRNTIYISDYGLTHKRIGVYVYLILCIAGLATTFIKINIGKNNWFLFRKNAWICYSLMIIACPFDWDSIITRFDISRFQSDRTMEIDQRYLAELGHTNLALLFQYYIVDDKTLHAQTDTSQTWTMSRSNSGESAYTQEIKNMIWQKYQDLEENYASHSWQSHCMSTSDNLHAMEKMIKQYNLISPPDHSYPKTY